MCQATRYFTPRCITLRLYQCRDVIKYNYQSTSALALATQYRTATHQYLMAAGTEQANFFMPVSITLTTVAGNGINKRGQMLML